MIKRLSLLLAIAMLLALPFGAFAQVAAPPDARQCAPAPRGTGTAPIWGLNDVGAYVAWHCVDDFSVTQRLFVLRWDGITPELRADLSSLSSAPDLAARIQELQPKHWSLPIDDARLLEVWGRDDERIWVARPPPPVWRVPHNARAADGSRPMQLLTADGQLGAADYARAAAEALCDCSVRVISGATTYCAVPPTRTSVAVCRKQ